MCRRGWQPAELKRSREGDRRKAAYVIMRGSAIFNSSPSVL
jgi:hypothetical protein